jgi:hypothetical protein
MLLFLVVAIGCTRTLSFCVEDAATLKPPGGVHAILQADRLDLLLGYSGERSDLGVSSSDGKIVASGIRTYGQWKSSILFRKQGYFDGGCIYVANDQSEVTVAARTAGNKNDVDDFKNEAIPSSGIITILLNPAPPTEQNTALPHFPAK